MSEKKTCFIIRPFSEPFNTRSEKIYKPAIIAAGLEPVEAGVPGDNKITDKIEEGIRNAAICLADLTLVMRRDHKNREHYEHNPNVWYELGFAFAYHGQAVMVCNVDIRSMSSLPFDISHRFVNDYGNSVDTDKHARKGVAASITEDLQEKLRNVAKFAPQPRNGQQANNIGNADHLLNKISLTNDEILGVRVLLHHSLALRGHVAVKVIAEWFDDNDANIRANLAINGLISKEIIENFDGRYHFTNKGKQWCSENHHLILEEYK